MFPPMVVQMVGVGEQTGELDQMLQKLADFSTKKKQMPPSRIF
jgi:type IV pilus assembly protein PilC